MRSETYGFGSHTQSITRRLGRTPQRPAEPPSEPAPVDSDRFKTRRGGELFVVASESAKELTPSRGYEGVERDGRDVTHG